MNVATIEMDQVKAREAFDEYRAAVKTRHDAEDVAIMRGYKALAAATVGRLAGPAASRLTRCPFSAGFSANLSSIILACRGGCFWGVLDELQTCDYVPKSTVGQSCRPNLPVRCQQTSRTPSCPAAPEGARCHFPRPLLA